MASHDTNDDTDGVARHAASSGDTNAPGGDKDDRQAVSRRVAASRGDTNRQRKVSPKYASGDSRVIDGDLRAVRFEIRVVEAGTPEARELLARQAAMVKRVLQWFADHPAPSEGQAHGS
jgi:hypothetical protein